MANQASMLVIATGFLRLTVEVSRTTTKVQTAANNDSHAEINEIVDGLSPLRDLFWRLKKISLTNTTPSSLLQQSTALWSTFVDCRETLFALYQKLSITLADHNKTSKLTSQFLEWPYKKGEIPLVIKALRDYRNMFDTFVQTAVEGVLDDRAALLDTLGLYHAIRHKQTGDSKELHRAILKAKKAVSAAPAGNHKRSAYLFNLAHLLGIRYDGGGELEDLQNAILFGGESLAMVPSSEPGQSFRLHRLSTLRLKLYKRTGNPNDLQLAIGHAEQAVVLIPPDGTDPNRAMFLDNLSDMLGMRYRHTGQLEDINKSIFKADEALKEITADYHDRPWMLFNLSMKLNSRYEKTMSIDDLERAILNARMASSKLVPGHPEQAKFLTNLGKLLEVKFQRTGDLKQIEEAVAVIEASLSATASGDPDRAWRLNILGNMLESRYERTADLGDIQHAILRAKEAVATTSPRHRDWEAIMINLSNHQMLKYEHTARLEDLNEAILSAEAAISATGGGTPGRAVSEYNLSSFLGLRFDRTGASKDLERAILLAEKSAALVPPEHPNRTAMLNNLSNNLDRRYQQTGLLKDLDQAIEKAEEALDLTLPNHPNRATILRSLSTKLGQRYKLAGTFKDLEEAIRRVDEAFKLIPSYQPDRAVILCSFMVMLMWRYQRTGESTDLQRVTAAADEVMEAMPVNHRDRAFCLDALGEVHSIRYEKTSTIEYLTEAIRLNEQAASEAPIDCPHRTQYLQKWACNLKLKYQRTSSLEDLSEAIRRAKEAVSMTLIYRSDHPDEKTMLGDLLLLRYNRTGQMEDLREAIRMYEEALAATSVTHRNRPVYLNNLSDCLRSCYDRTKALGTLKQAICRAKEALAILPADHSDRTGPLNNLATCLLLRYGREERDDDLEEAFRFGLEALTLWRNEVLSGALSAATSDSLKGLVILNNLARIFNAKYGKTGNIHHLESCISLAEETVKATPTDFISRAMYVHNLAVLTKEKYVKTEKFADLQEAIRLAEQAAGISSVDQPVRAGALTNLGFCLNLRYKRDHYREDYHRSLECLTEACSCQASSPLDRIEASRQAIQMLVDSSKWEEASNLVDQAIGLFPLVSPRTLRQGDQQFILSELFGIAAHACSIALQAGRTPSHALRLLELSRGVIVGFKIDSRGDLQKLKESNPDLCDAFQQLRINMDSDVGEFGEVHSSMSEKLKKSADYIVQMDETLARIRKLPGHENFQLPASPEELRAVSREGPIVVLNATSIRSDAIIVTDADIKALNLPKFTFTDLVMWVEIIIGDMRTGGLKDYALNNKKMKQLLLWLWDVVVEPVLKELHFEPKGEVENLPRISWIGVGILSLLPIHAAGDHSPGSLRNTLSYAVSSYTPTIKALSYAREKNLSLFEKPDAKLLLVTMPTTPGQPPLTGVTTEAAEIEAIAGNTLRVTTFNRPSAAAVLNSLRAYDIVHCACHGVSMADDPSESHLLLLKDGGPEYMTESADKLNVRDISSANTTLQLAYLSACCSADNPAVLLSDEAIHIASAFQLAGVSHVIGTLWPTKDDTSVVLAREFYTALIRSKESGDRHRRIATVLHEAVLVARAKHRNQPLRWAPFVHLGA